MSEKEQLWTSNPPLAPWRRIYADELIISPNSYGEKLPETGLQGQVFILVLPLSTKE